MRLEEKEERICMEVRAKGGKGPLLFEWDPETQTVDLIRKDMYYKVHLDKHSYLRS